MAAEWENNNSTFDTAMKDAPAPLAEKDPNVDPAAMARSKGWSEPQKYNYDLYNAQELKVLEDGSEGQWASNAAKYEWKEEYGDIGPRHEELEKMLFHSDLTARAGEMFEKYDNSPPPLNSNLGKIGEQTKHPKHIFLWLKVCPQSQSPLNQSYC